MDQPTGARIHKIVWIACPNGLGANGRQLRFSLCAHHRLELEVNNPASHGTPSELTLDAFPAALTWAKQHLKFSITIEGGGSALHVPGHGGRLQVVSAPPDPQLWDALFGKNTPVTPFTFVDQSLQSEPLA